MLKLSLTTAAALMALTHVAHAGGPAGTHGQDTGADWGGYVSDAAQGGGIGGHVSDENSDGSASGGGIPAAHGKSGREFGGFVSGAAQGGGIGGHASDPEGP